MQSYLKLLRPNQWIKNVFVFAGLIFSRQFYYPACIIRSIAAFIIFSMISSSVYILNDVVDHAEDRLNPAKKNRPIATGVVRRGHALLMGALLALLALAGAFAIERYFFYVCLLYLILMTLYSLWARQVVILDVLFVAGAYVVRAVAGAAVIRVDISSWLIVCTFLLALFIVLLKRKGEMVVLGNAAADQRKVLGSYTLPMLIQLITVAVTACIVSYCIYTLSPETIIKFHTKRLVYTIPLVMYGLLRYLYIADKGSGVDTPDRLLFKDAGLLVSIGLWVVACILILL
jgi:4-hydroxybenzoate polyprenyltransferase